MPTTPTILNGSRLTLGVSAAVMSALTMSGCGGDLRFQQKQGLTLTAAAGTTLRIQNKVGDIKLIADPAATEVRAEIIKIGKGSTETKAREALSEIEVTLVDLGGTDGVVGKVTHPNQSGGWSNKGYEVVWMITAPPGMAVNVTDAVGDVTVTGFDLGLKLMTDVGDVTAKDIKGGIEIATDVGDVHATGNAPINARTDVGDVHIVALSGELNDLTATTDVGDIHVTLPPGWIGHLNASTDVGDVRTDVPNLKAKGRSTRKHIVAEIGEAGGKAQLKAQADVGDVVIRTGG